jgi:hypothetical protein
VPRKVTIYSVVTKLLSTGSELNEKKSLKRPVLTEEELANINAPLESSVKKSLRLLAF